jgi:hypothetical protein
VLVWLAGQLQAWLDFARGLVAEQDQPAPCERQCAIECRRLFTQEAQVERIENRIRATGPVVARAHRAARGLLQQVERMREQQIETPERAARDALEQRGIAFRESTVQIEERGGACVDDARYDGRRETGRGFHRGASDLPLRTRDVGALPSKTWRPGPSTPIDVCLRHIE